MRQIDAEVTVHPMPGGGLQLHIKGATGESFGVELRREAAVAHRDAVAGVVDGRSEEPAPAEPPPANDQAPTDPSPPARRSRRKRAE